jgi:hypothetical protein
MEYNGIVLPAALAMMTYVLDDFCREHQISGGEARKRTASLIIALYRHGYQTTDDLREALENSGVASKLATLPTAALRETVAPPECEPHR